jgi:hypothetical protein
MSTNPYEPPQEDCRPPPRAPWPFWSYVALALLVGIPWTLFAIAAVLDVLDSHGYLPRT